MKMLVKFELIIGVKNQFFSSSWPSASSPLAASSAISLAIYSLNLSNPISAPSAICTSRVVSVRIFRSTKQNGSQILFPLWNKSKS
tara:strand:+ start:24 stop:281 length:258 start_codon:yes stop_codon:yes gene_type:complete